MSAMLSVIQLKVGPKVFHDHLRLTLEMNWPLLSVWIDADVCLSHEIHGPTGAFKIRGGLHYFERLTKGDAKEQDFIYAPMSNQIRSLPFSRARQKMPSAIRPPSSVRLRRIWPLRFCEVMVAQRPGQKVDFVCSGENESAIFSKTSLGEKY